MFLGIVVSTSAMYDRDISQSHPAMFWNAQACLLLYFLYAFMFCALYIETYHKQFRPNMTVFLTAFHILGLVGIYKMVTHERCASLLGEAVALYLVSGLGITCGAHRLWAHRSYKAALPFRIVLMILNSVANQGCIFHWARDHRVHHKYSEEEADPHNAKLGFFYSHMGWLLWTKPEAVAKAGREVDCSDMLQDSVVVWQRKLDPYWNQTMCFILPGIYAQYKYGSFWLGFFVLGVLRWLICLHATWTVNSVAHLWGDRPYDPNITRQNLFSLPLWPTVKDGTTGTTCIPLTTRRVRGAFSPSGILRSSSLTQLR